MRMIVVVALLAHFLSVLVRFLRRQESAAVLGNAAPDVYSAAPVIQAAIVAGGGRVAAQPAAGLSGKRPSNRRSIGGRRLATSSRGWSWP